VIADHKILLQNKYTTTETRAYNYMYMLLKHIEN